jgi:hypothetical protein
MAWDLLAPGLGFVRCLGVLVFLLPLGFLPATGQGLGNAGGDHEGLPHSAVQDIVHSV